MVLKKIAECFCRVALRSQCHLGTGHILSSWKVFVGDSLFMINFDAEFSYSLETFPLVWLLNLQFCWSRLNKTYDSSNYYHVDEHLSNAIQNLQVWLVFNLIGSLSQILLVMTGSLMAPISHIRDHLPAKTFVQWLFCNYPNLIAFLSGSKCCRSTLYNWICVRAAELNIEN